MAFIPVAITMALNTYEKQQLSMLERSNVQQGRLVAAALETNSSLSVDKAFVEDIFKNMEGRFDSRIRVLNEKGELIADSALSSSAENISNSSKATILYRNENQTKSNSSTEEASQTLLYKIFSFPVRFYRRYLRPPRPNYSTADFYDNKKIYDGKEVLSALEGRYGATTRISSGGQVSVTLYSAIPVEKDQKVYGVVLVSGSTYRILQNLYELRLDLGKIFLRSLIVVLLVALFLVFRIVVPIRKLSKEAGLCADKKGRVSFTKFTGGRRKDEIGQLSRAFSALVERLNKRIKFAQAFSSDISHEFKNPLTAIRSSAELLGDDSLSKDERAELSRAVVEEVVHLQNLLTGVRNISKIDAQELVEDILEIEANSFIKNIILRIQKNYPDVTINFESNCDKITLKMVPQYLEIISANLIDNAASFGKNVRVSANLKNLKKNKNLFDLKVDDDGPGLALEECKKIFERFYSNRDESQKSNHNGLGLSLVKAISDNLEGQIRVEKSSDLGGASFIFEVLI